MKEKDLLFIISLPRSGSTLLQTMLANHSQVDSRPEHWILFQYMTYFEPEKYNAKFHLHTANKHFSGLLNAIDSESEYLNKLRKFILDQYESMRRLKSGYFLDKTPRYYEIIDGIRLLFPNSKVIVLKRNPLDVLLSLVEKKDSRIRSLDFNKRDILEGPRIIKEIQSKYYNDPNFYFIHYEDLIRHPQDVLKKLTQWMGLNFEQNQLDLKNIDVAHQSFGDQKILNTSKVHQSSLNRWNNASNFYEKMMIEGYAFYLGSSLLNSLGYKMDYVGSSNKLFNLFLKRHGKIKAKTLQSRLKYKFERYRYRNFV